MLTSVGTQYVYLANLLLMNVRNVVGKKYIYLVPMTLVITAGWACLPIHVCCTRLHNPLVFVCLRLYGLALYSVAVQLNSYRSSGGSESILLNMLGWSPIQIVLSDSCSILVVPRSRSASQRSRSASPRSRSASQCSRSASPRSRFASQRSHSS